MRGTSQRVDKLFRKAGADVAFRRTLAPGGHKGDIGLIYAKA
ncbi:hypothetical protein B0H94_110117 [Salsuginibacillus halophilus]|uniref:Uncharacterized protein n=1 Tax=Salsuginibacillus halophilus TaxID=517424 RepID=A0A2P8HBZ3_9BACI|nr:hypothetical protein B0H94_110117 [Salsuginibacillus halophilus]